MRLPNHLLFADVVALLSEGYTVTLRTKGSSMFPFIVGGRDSVALRKRKHVCKGDIVLARIPEKTYVLHRVCRVEGDVFVLMGDGNVCVTETCRKEDILGTVLTITRNGRLMDCSSPAEALKVRFWRLALPVRRYLLPACRWWIKVMGKKKGL